MQSISGLMLTKVASFIDGNYSSLKIRIVLRNSLDDILGCRLRIHSHSHTFYYLITTEARHIT